MLKHVNIKNVQTQTTLMNEKTATIKQRVKPMNKTTLIYIHSESSHFNSINMTGFGTQSVGALYSD